MACFKKYKWYLVIIVMLLGSCNDQSAGSIEKEPGSSGPPEKAITIDAPGLRVGGLYLFKNDDSTFYVSKILVLDDFAVHVRTYSNKFDKRPSQLNSDTLKILIGHFPMDKAGFLKDNPELLTVEGVKDSELEGYKIYMEEMNK